MARTKGAIAYQIDMAEVEKLASIGATQPEMAAWFGVSLSTIEKRLSNETERIALEKGMAKFKLSVRRKQAQLLEEGNVTMAIWLGKQVLGQRDGLDMKVSGSVDLISRINAGRQRAALAGKNEPDNG